MVSFNKVILIGNLTRDPEIRYNPSGLAVANFTLAINRRTGKGSEKKEEVSFFDLVAFDKQAELISQYFHKGSSILVEGRLQQRRWETDDGQKRSKVEVVVTALEFMPKRQGAEGGEPGEIIEEGDIPF